MDFASPSARTRGNTMRMAGSTAIAEKAFGSVEPASTQHVPEWVPDDTAHSCMLCHSSFTFLSRRHHCRSCGFLVCDSCSHARLLLPLFQAPERVCDRCVNELGEAAEHSITRSVNTRSITRTASSSTAAAPGSGTTAVGPALPPRGAGPSSSAVSAFAASTSSTTPFPISAASLPAWAVAFARAVPLFSSSSSSSSSGIGVPVTVGCLLVRPIAARSVSFPAPATAAAVMRAADSAAAKLDLSSSSRGRRPIPGTRTRSGRHQAHLAAAVAAAVTDVCSADMPFFTLSASLGPARAVVGAARARALPFTPPAGSEAALMPSVLSAALAAGAGEAGGAAADADFAAAAAATASAATVSDGGLTFPSEGAVLPVPAASCARVLTLVLCDSKTGAVMGTAQLPLWRLKTGQRVRVTLPLTAPHHHHQHHSASSPAAAAAAAAAAADNAGDASEGGSLTPSASFSRSRSRSSSTASGSKRGCPRITVDVELALAGTAAWWAEATAPDTAGLAAVFAPSQPIGAAVAGAGAGVGAYAAEVETETGSFIAPPAPADSGSASTSATTGDGLLVRSLSANIGEVYYAADSELMGSALPNSASATAATAAAIAAVASTPTALATPKNASAITGVAPSPSPAPALAALLSDCVHILSLFRPLFFAVDAASPLLARRAPVLTVAAAAAALYIALQPWALLPLLLAVALRAVAAGPLTAAVVAARGGSPAASAGAGARGKKEYDDCDSSSDSDDDDDDDDDDVGSTPLSLYGGGSGSSSACSPARVTSLCRQLPGARSDGGDSADAALAAVLTSLLGDLVAPGGAPAAVRGAVVVSRARVAARGIRGAAEAAAGLFKMQRLRGHVHGHAHAHGEKGQWVDVVLPAAAVVLLTVAFLWSLFAPQAPLWAAIVVVAFTINTPVRFAAVAATRAGAKLWRERVARG